MVPILVEIAVWWGSRHWSCNHKTDSLILNYEKYLEGKVNRYGSMQLVGGGTLLHVEQVDKASDSIGAEIWN